LDEIAESGYRFDTAQPLAYNTPMNIEEIKPTLENLRTRMDRLTEKRA